jgi:hypothetical protein
MKLFKNIGILFLLLGMVSCQEDDLGLDTIMVPSNLNVSTSITDDGSGLVTFTTTASNAITYHYNFNDGSTIVSPSGVYTHQFSDTGLNTYTVNVVAYGAGGTSSSILVDVEVLVTYEPPQELIEKLVGDGNKKWRIKAEVDGHFGLGPVGGTIPAEWFSAPANSKAGVGMYDDRYIFKSDGSFTHIVDNTNDDPNLDPSGTVFGRINLIDELGSSGGSVDGADVLNLPYNDYNASWSIIAPGGVETINLTGIGFIGYYTGGDHRYEIYNRSGANDLVLRTTDGNGEFDWWFIITSTPVGAAGEEEQGFQSKFTNLEWEENFDVDGNLDTNLWNFEIGNNDGWGNDEKQYYTDNNAVVQNGNLVITAKAESSNGYNYTSSRITTQDNYEFTYGRVEVRAKLPEGGGTWPAIWMLGANFDEVGWPATGEIDILEHKGNEPNTIHGTLHYPGNSGSGDGSTTLISNASSEFHIYTMEWSADRIVFLVDDEVYHTYDNTPDSPFNKDFFFILNVAMGGTFGGDIDPNFNESSLEVDYIKLYS